MDVVSEVCLDNAHVHGGESNGDEHDAGKGGDEEQEHPLVHLLVEYVEPEPDGENAAGYEAEGELSGQQLIV